MQKLQKHLFVQKEMIEEIESGRFKDKHHSESINKLNPSVQDSLNILPSIQEGLGQLSLNTIEE
jgi:hypothetical protein